MSGNFSCDYSWSEATQKATLQTLKRELWAACPLKLYQYKPQEQGNRGDQQMDNSTDSDSWMIHSFETQTGKLATEYYMKSIVCLIGYRCSCSIC